MPEDRRFSVWQFFEDGTNEQVRSDVSVAEAMLAVEHYTDNVAAKIGVTRRVIVVDDGDCINFEWKYGEGVTFR